MRPCRWQRSFFAVGCLGALLATAALRAGEPLRQRIDAEIKVAWQREKITPAGRADDATFLRRVSLDLIGTLPTATEVEQFLNDKDPCKRSKRIDRLLDDPRFGAQQATVWDLVLFGRNPPNGNLVRRRDGFRKWLNEHFAKNEPYDRWVRGLLLAEQEGSQAFYAQFRNQPEEATVAVSRIFLGTQLQCARCHDHPFESWTQRDFYGMAAFFVRLAVVEAGALRFRITEKSTGEVMFTGSAKDAKPGQKGEPVKPKFLNGAVLDEADVKDKGALAAFSRKAKLAEWVTAADNPYFARAVANRVWAQFMGRGFVHPIDDLNGKTAPSHPELLDQIVRELIAQRFDLKWLIRELVNTETYQQAATGTVAEALPKWYERARVRPLSAEEMMSAIRMATGDGTGKPEEGKFSATASELFLRYLGEPVNGQGEFQGSLSEHLFLNHSAELRGLTQRRQGNLADRLLSSTEPWEKRVDHLFLSVLNRLPRPEEQKRFVAYLSDTQLEMRVSEAIWVLLNCAEFRFNR